MNKNMPLIFLQILCKNLRYAQKFIIQKYIFIYLNPSSDILKQYSLNEKVNFKNLIKTSKTILNFIQRKFKMFSTIFFYSGWSHPSFPYFFVFFSSSEMKWIWWHFKLRKVFYVNLNEKLSLRSRFFFSFLKRKFLRRPL